jgi:hypothetical protein
METNSRAPTPAARRPALSPIPAARSLGRPGAVTAAAL